MVYVFSEGYLNASAKLGNDDLFKFIEMLKTKGLINTTNIKDNFKYLISANNFVTAITETEERVNNASLVSINSIIGLNSDANLNISENLFNLQVPFTKTAGIESHTKLNEFFVDFFYDLLKDNEELKKLGFFNSWKPLGEEYYIETNLYKKLLPQIKDEDTFKKFKARVVKEINLLLGNYYLSELINIHRVSSLESLHTLVSKSSKVSIKVLSKNIATNLMQNIGTLPVANSNPDSTFKRLYAELRNDLVIFNQLLNYIDETEEAKIKISINDLYFTNERIYKSIQRIAKYCQSGCLDEINLSDISELSNALTNNLITGLKNGDLNDVVIKIKSIPIEKYTILIDLIQRMHKLNEAETYDYILKSIKYFGENILDKRAPVLNIITENLEKYSLINTDSNSVTLKSEEIIEALYNRYGNVSFSFCQKLPSLKIAPYFTVGVNTGSWINTRYNTKKDKLNFGEYLPTDSVNGVIQPKQSFSNISEKIGFKIMVDFKAHRNVNYTTSIKKHKALEPFVQDVHLLVYSSGILYNIYNTTTKNDFNYPLLGIATGLSFFNGLDVNYFLSSPIVSGEEFYKYFDARLYHGLSLEIKIVEYISAIRKKRLTNKN
jgi:hypothetical protein